MGKATFPVIPSSPALPWWSTSRQCSSVTYYNLFSVVQVQILHLQNHLAMFSMKNSNTHTPKSLGPFEGDEMVLEDNLE